MNDEVKQGLLQRLLNSYESAQASGEGATRLGIAYSVRNKTFSLDIDDVPHSLSAHYVADNTPNGDELVEKIKRWVHGGSIE